MCCVDMIAPSSTIWDHLGQSVRVDAARPFRVDLQAPYELEPIEKTEDEWVHMLGRGEPATNPWPGKRNKHISAVDFTDHGDRGGGRAFARAAFLVWVTNEITSLAGAGYGTSADGLIFFSTACGCNEVISIPW